MSTWRKATEPSHNQYVLQHGCYPWGSRYKTFETKNLWCRAFPEHNPPNPRDKQREKLLNVFCLWCPGKEIHRKQDRMINFSGMNRPLGITSITSRIPDESTGNRNTVGCTIMFLTHYLVSRCWSTLASRLSHIQNKSTLFVCCCTTAVFYASMLRIINTTLRKPVRQSIGASASLEDLRRNSWSIRMPCLFPVKPMVRSSKPESLKVSVRNRTSGSGCAIRPIRKARDRLLNIVGKV